MLDGLKNFVKFYLKKSYLFNKYFGMPEIGDSFGELSKNEMKYIYAFTETIYGTSNQNEIQELHGIIGEWADRKTITDGYYKAYRKGINYIKILTQKKWRNIPFYKLSIEKRVQVFEGRIYLLSEMYKYPTLRNPIKLFLFFFNCIIYQKRNNNSFYLEIVRRDLIKGIFNSKLGWQLVGYTSMPGVKGDSLEYTRPPKI